MGTFFSCSAKLLLLFFIVSAIPIAIIIHLETGGRPSTHVIQYHSTGWFRECAKWDDQGRRFLVTFFDGGVGQIPVPLDYDDGSAGSVLQETVVVKEVDLAGNASLGFAIDRRRNRVLVAVADVFGNRYSALAAYDLSTWKRIFLTKLGGPEDEKSFADDVAVDEEGNAYVTDAKASKIWKVGPEGELQHTIRSPLFTPKEWYKNLVALNGIVYHPNGYLLVVHTFSGNLYKVQTAKGNKVEIVNVVGGSLRFGDGLLLVSPDKLVVAGNPTRLVESSDDWESARIVGKSKDAIHRVATAATEKDGRVYVSHLVGMGYPRRKHVLVEAVFSA
nr:Mucin-5AC like [Ipomoea batatas]